MRGLMTACLLAVLPFAATANPIKNAGNYTPAALAKVKMSGDEAILFHLMAGFCTKCEQQKVAIGGAAEAEPNLHRHVVVVDVPLETWQDSSLLKKLEASEAGTMILVRDDEILGRTDSTDPMEISTLLGKALPFPTGGLVDPATGFPIDPATGLPIDPATGQPVLPAQ